MERYPFAAIKELALRARNKMAFISGSRDK